MLYTGRAPFGAAPSGEPVEQLTLTDGVLSCRILTLGAILRALTVPDAQGRPVDVVLGCDSPEEYLAQADYLGAIVGRYANRIAGGQFVLNGRRYTLEKNGGACHLHGGRIGFSRRVWTVESLTDSQAALRLDSPDGEEGYPGRLSARVTYALNGGTLSIRYEAESDADTLCNLTNHAYFNLSGHGSGPVLDQEVALSARYYTPADENGIPLGTLACVDGTPMDLRTPAPVGFRLRNGEAQLRRSRGFDHNYVIDGEPGVLRPAAWARSPAAGIRMTVETTYPGVQYYTANFLAEGRRGKNGSRYGPRHGFCIETEYFPDSPNQAAFPSPVLRAGQRYDQKTRYTFSCGSTKNPGDGGTP